MNLGISSIQYEYYIELNTRDTQVQERSLGNGPVTAALEGRRILAKSLVWGNTAIGVHSALHVISSIKITFEKTSGFMEKTGGWRGGWVHTWMHERMGRG